MSSRAARAALPWLMTLSGFCGISYEILYNRLLGNLLGNQFTISATVLLTFLLGIGLGTLYAHRLARHLWLIEAVIGLYAALMVVAYRWIGAFLYEILPALGGNLYAVAAVSFVLLAVPAFLIGCSVPLFAGYLSSVRASGVFSTTYGLYNLGAALTALAIEFALLRVLGIRATTLCLAALNGVVAIGVLALTRTAPLIPAPGSDRLRYPARVFAALASASVASAIFQLLMIKLAEFVFGPYNETFALVLATVLLGLAVGATLAGRLGLTFNGSLLLAMLGLAGLLAALPAAIGLFARLYPAAGQSYLTLILLKLGFVAALMGLPAVGFGATIPALLRSYRNVARESGQLLFCSALANSLGFLLMAFVLHRHLDYGPILLFCAGITAAALIVHNARASGVVIASVLLVLLAAGGYAAFWEETLLYTGHTNLRSPQELREARQGRVFADRFKGPRDVFAILWRNDIPYFFINGYISIPMAGENASERLVGALSAMLSPRTDRALVLGLGSGATAGTVGLIFDETDVVEINGAVLENLHLMRQYNFDVENIPNLRIIHDDGIHYARTAGEPYSLILNTVTTPLYFSSSKLYTRDFFQIIKERLTPDGVYITWVDARIGDVGFDIILESLATSFESCWLSYMDADYYILACSNGEIRLSQYETVAGDERFRRHFAEENLLPLRLLPYSVLSTRALELRPISSVPINTLDFPVLEFEMARLPYLAPLNEFLRRMHDRMELPRVKADLSYEMDWDPVEFAFMRDLRLKGKSTLKNTLLSTVPWQFDIRDEEYDRVVLELAEELGSAAACFRYGERLLARERHEAAATLFARSLEKNPAQREANYHIGKLLLASGQYEQALPHFVQEWELNRDPAVAAAASVALAELGRFPESMEWLEQTEGRVGEEDLDRVAASAQRALREDSSDEAARTALERVARVSAARVDPDQD